MPLQLSDVQIFNRALQVLGETGYPVTAVDGTDTSKFGKMAWPLYYMTRTEELRSYKWISVKKRAVLVQAQVTASSTWTSGSAIIAVTTAGIQPGWLVANMLMQGGGSITTPPGIPAGAYVLSITDSAHLVMSANATANGSGDIIYQVNNLTGYWYAYIAPTDMLRRESIYSVFPDYTYLWPYKIQNIQNFDATYENGYIYTNMDPNNNNPTVEYVADISTAQQYCSGTLAGSIHVTTVTGLTITPAMVGWYVIGTGVPVGTTISAYVSSSAFDLSKAATVSATEALTLAPPNNLPADFAEAVALRIAVKLCMAVTRNLQLQQMIDGQYVAVITRAQGNNQIEATSEQMGDLWWTDRGR